MGWVDDLITLAGTGVGAAGGFVFGGPAGAAVGAGLGGEAGHFIGSQVDDNGAGDEARKLASIYENINYKDPMSDPAYAQEVNQLKEYATGKMTASDKARELEALSQAGGFAKGREGAIEQEQATKGAGVANAGMTGVMKAEAAQGAAGRLSQADVATAGMASDRGFAANQEFLRQMAMNDQMQNQFMLAKAGGASANNLAYLNYLGATQAAQQQALQGFVSGLGKAGLAYKFGTPTSPAASPTASATAAPASGFSATLSDPTLGATPLTTAPTGSSTFGPPVESGSPDAATQLRALLSPVPVDQGAPAGAAPSKAAINPDEDYPEGNSPWSPRRKVQQPRFQ